jgi:hypothetical protein
MSRVQKSDNKCKRVMSEAVAGSISFHLYTITDTFNLPISRDENIYIAMVFVSTNQALHVTMGQHYASSITTYHTSSATSLQTNTDVDTHRHTDTYTHRHTDTHIYTYHVQNLPSTDQKSRIRSLMGMIAREVVDHFGI